MCNLALERNATASWETLRGKGGVRDQSGRESKSEFCGSFPSALESNFWLCPRKTGFVCFCKGVHHYYPNKLRNWSITCRSHQSDHIYREIQLWAPHSMVTLQQGPGTPLEENSAEKGHLPLSTMTRPWDKDKADCESSGLVVPCRQPAG